jgi:hypothetical protein
VWQLDKILPRSRWPNCLFAVGWGLALLAIALCGLTLSWKLGLVTLLCLLMLLSHRQAVQVRAISIDKDRCTLRLSNHETIELAPPYHSTQLVWWVSLQYRDGFAGRWLWLYRDQFNDDEWRHLAALLHWSA